MGQSRQRENALKRAIIDFMEATMLAPNVGQHFGATVINHRRDNTVCLIRDPAIVATVHPKPQLGQQVQMKLLSGDPASRTLHFKRG